MENEGKYHEALSVYIESLALSPRHYDLRKSIGKMHRLLGDNENSIDIFKQLLLPSPKSGELNLEIAKSYYVDGNREKALAHLENTLDTWENADSSHKPSIEAREKWTKWNQVN